MIPVDALDDREVDQLLEGRVPPGRDELAPLAAIVASIRSAFSGRADRDGEACRRFVPRLALLMTTDNGDPVAMPVSNANRPRRGEVSGLPKWRRYSVSALFTSLLSSVVGKAAVGAVTLAAVTGVVATTTDQDPEKVVVSTVSETDESTTTLDASTDTTVAETTETTEATETTETTTVDETVVDDTDTEAAEEVVETETDTEEVVEAEPVEPKDNHGAVVSEAAKDHSHDEECGTHGRYVSSVAKGEASCTPKAPKTPEREAEAEAAPAPVAPQTAEVPEADVAPAPSDGPGKGQAKKGAGGKKG